MTTTIQMDCGDNVVDLDALRAVLLNSKAAPGGLQGVTLEGAALALEYAEDPGADVGEVLRVVSGWCKGDAPITVTGPEQHAGQTLLPTTAAGPERWRCPRCSNPVVRGRNSVEGILGQGICKACHDVDIKLGGGAPKAAAPKPAAPAAAPKPKPPVAMPPAAATPAGRPAVSMPQTLAPQPTALPPELAAPPVTPDELPEPFTLGLSRLPCFATATDLPEPVGLGPGVLVFVLDAQRLMLSTNAGWATVAWNVAILG